MANNIDTTLKVFKDEAAFQAIMNSFYGSSETFSFNNIIPTPDFLQDAELRQWRLENWGCSFDGEVEHINIKRQILAFRTKTYTPDLVIKTLSIKNPSVTFNCRYSDLLGSIYPIERSIRNGIILSEKVFADVLEIRGITSCENCGENFRILPLVQIEDIQKEPYTGQKIIPRMRINQRTKKLEKYFVCRNCNPNQWSTP